MSYTFLIVIAFLGIAGFAIWQALHNPAVIAGLVKIAFDHVLPTLLKRLPPEREAEWRDRVRRSEKDDAR